MINVVAIDGAAGSGKSTLAKALAIELGLPYVNTGLMYRAVARAALDAGLDLDDEEAVLTVIPGSRFRLAGEPGELEVEGYPLETLHSPEVDAAVSAVARHPKVRAIMRAEQRAIGSGRGAVMEGRDIGTVVFPDAALKIFLRADPKEREARRAGERGAPDGEVASALRARDLADSRVNPLEPASDAIVLDTTDANAEDTLRQALDLARERLA